MIDPDNYELEVDQFDDDMNAFFEWLDTVDWEFFRVPLSQEQKLYSAFKAGIEYAKHKE